MNKNIYNCDIWVLSKVIEQKWEQLLSVDVKMISLKEEKYDMLQTYILSFSRSEADKLNYLYTFHLYKYESDFDSDRFRKLFYLKNKDIKENKSFLELSFEDFNKLLKKEDVSDQIFQDEDWYITFINHAKEKLLVLEKKYDELNEKCKEDKTIDTKKIKKDEEEEIYEYSQDLLFYVINVKLNKIPFYTWNYEESIKLLKKKSADKIDKTLWNRFLHLTLYWKGDKTIDL